MDEIFIERIKSLIEESNLSLDALAKDLGFKSKSTIFKYSHGQIVKIGPTQINKLATYFKVSPSWLAGFTDDKYYNI